MRYTTQINNVKSLEWGLNLPQAYLFSWLYELPSWAESALIEREPYYFAARQKVVEELPMLTSNPATVYGHFKTLAKIGLIEYTKIGKKDFIRLTEKGQTWNEVETQIEIRDLDNYPSELRNISEKNSDKNLTYKTTIYDNMIKDKSAIPTLEEFIMYAKNKCEEVGFDFNLKKAAIALKYSAWVEAGWKAGKTLRPIKNWRATLSNTLPYLTNEKGDSNTYGRKVSEW
jgi:hypothetical protein